MLPASERPGPPRRDILEGVVVLLFLLLSEGKLLLALEMLLLLLLLLLLPLLRWEASVPSEVKWEELPLLLLL